MNANESTEIINEMEEEDNEEDWEELKNHTDYKINKNYPYQIKKKSNNHIVKESKDKKGYLKCHLNRKSYLKHRLIAEQFIPNPDNLPQIDHINHNRIDNRIENLRFVDNITNNNNKEHYRGNKIEYIDELPPDSIKIEFYKGIEFENYYYSRETQKCYFDNGVKIRVLKYYYSGYGIKYITAADISKKSRKICIDAWLRSECIE